MVLCCCPRRVAGTSSPRGWHCTLLLGSEVALAQKAPVTAASPVAVAGPAAQTAGSSLIQPQGPAHVLEQQRAVLLGGAGPASGAQRKWSSAMTDRRKKKKNSVSMRTVKRGAIGEPVLGDIQDPRSQGCPRCWPCSEAVGAEHARGSFQPIHLWLPFSVEAQAALCRQLGWLQSCGPCPVCSRQAKAQGTECCGRRHAMGQGAAGSAGADAHSFGQGASLGGGSAGARCERGAPPPVALRQRGGFAAHCHPSAPACE